jgi:phosphatidylinositol alpha-mannosyltransferase
LPAPTIFYVGRLEKRKGLKYLILAFAQLVAEQPNVQLVIGGDGSDREELEAMVHDMEIPNITFLGYVDDTEKINLLQRADVFCAPAIYGESFGIVLLEAIACGIPIVAGDNPGYRYVLTDRGALGLVNPKDTADFARKLKLMLTDEELRKAWKSWAKQYVKQFDYEHIVSSYETVYQEAIAKKRQEQ